MHSIRATLTHWSDSDRTTNAAMRLSCPPIETEHLKENSIDMASSDASKMFFSYCLILTISRQNGYIGLSSVKVYANKAKADNALSVVDCLPIVDIGAVWSH